MAALMAAFLPVAMMVLMLALGLRLAPREIFAALRAPRALGAGLALQLIALPALAFGLARVFGLSAPLAAGLMLVAASPGGVSSNYITHLARGSVALSVTMTLLTSLLAPLSLPLVLGLSGAAAPESGALWRISLGMSAVALAPLALGMAAGHLAPGFAARTSRLLDPLARLLFALMVGATFVQNWGAMRAGFASAGPAVLALAVLAPALALGVGRALSLGAAAGRTIAIEISLQNVAITIFVAGKLLGAPALAIPGLIYAVVMNIVALGFILSAPPRAPAPGSAPMPPPMPAPAPAPARAPR